MFRIPLLLILLVAGLYSYSQNDLDAIRYSRVGVNGTSRFVGMGGAFGAVGADMSCSAYNPAGLALYRRNDISFSGGIKASNNQGIINGTSITATDASFIFNNFGILGSWQAKNDVESRNIFSFTSTQTQNFNNTAEMSSYSTNSIVKAMYNKATAAGVPANLDPSYEGLGYDTYLLDFDSVTSKFVSFVDLKKVVLQTRKIVTTGKVNDRNFSYGYSYKDQFYFGVSIGVPKIQYTSTTTHTERDDKDSMRINPTSDTTFTSTYSGGLPYYFINNLGFNSLVYTEYLKTTGTGLNLKIGGISRVNDFLRVGFYYHTPTLYSLTDQYYYSISSTFDKNPSSPITEQYPPDNGGIFKYKIITPGKVSLNIAFIIKKLAVIAIDYEAVNYKAASLSSTDVTDFAGVNAVIKTKYRLGHNLRVGTEFNIKPVMLRFGYNMQGSPYGNAFTGNFVRNSFSIGLGIRAKNNIYFDLALIKTLTTEDYRLFNTDDPSQDSKATLKYNATNVSATIGLKF